MTVFFTASSVIPFICEYASSAFVSNSFTTLEMESEREEKWKSAEVGRDIDGRENPHPVESLSSSSFNSSSCSSCSSFFLVV